ncbi:MAG: hypothetical protein ABI461_01675, partial [Polyangiaceae bacterium]
TQPEPVSRYSTLVLVPDDAGGFKKIDAEPPIDATWAGSDVDAIMFEDIDGNGVLAPIVIAEYMTGMGPTGAQPFVKISVYRWHAGKMARARDIEGILDGAKDSAAVRARLAQRKRPKKPPL